MVIRRLLVLFLLFISNAAVLGSSRLPFLVEPPGIPTSNTYIQLSGCSSNCDVACCFCEIEKQPPFCLRCCFEDP
ncbi:hypothetical protein Scep_021088 [Stephania cephalantha]|uniref:Uncharacterized protein n=1 Tax=Stephania cephalantha TaxID=152367 RepID=A0AAP0FCG9_9MAGN